MTWWWLSFCAATDGRNLGLAVVQASSPEEAFRVAGVLEAGPTEDGETMIVAVPASAGPPPRGYANRLLTVDEARAMQAQWTPDQPEVRKLRDFADEGDPLALQLLGEELLS